ncbi:MAG: class I SAM-dependent methyltransferase, partial [Alphaproteobacteria bacterium]
MDRVATLTDRQAREIEYHRHHAAAQRTAVVERRLSLAIIRDAARRPWNAYWSLYDRLRAWGVEGRRVLVAGCGFGDDAILLSLMGAEVSANDISPESVDIALRRAARHGAAFDARVMPIEQLDYPDDHFDAVVFIDILHHVDIPAAMAEVRRVLRPGAMIFGDELYTHSWLQAVRESRPVVRVLYPAMQRFIYGTDKPYITPDEHKIDEAELRVVLDHLAAPRVT